MPFWDIAPRCLTDQKRFIQKFPNTLSAMLYDWQNGFSTSTTLLTSWSRVRHALRITFELNSRVLACAIKPCWVGSVLFLIKSKIWFDNQYYLLVLYNIFSLSTRVVNCTRRYFSACIYSGNFIPKPLDMKLRDRFHISGNDLSYIWIGVSGSCCLLALKMSTVFGMSDQNSFP